MEIAKKLIDYVMDILETVVFIGSIFIVVYLFIMAPHQVQGASMDNSFHEGDYILTNKLAYRLGNPERGDIIVFKSPRNPDKDYIKRIIGIPGDKIKIENAHVYVNDSLLDEKYIASTTNVNKDWFIKEGVEVFVPPEHLFVMGDNRSYSSDSRDFGFIPIKDLIGKVFFRYFPPPVFGPIKNPYKSLLPGNNLRLLKMVEFS